MLDTTRRLPYTFLMQPTTIRTFFACQISKENLAGIDQLLIELKSVTPAAVKWVNPKNLHLTIKFLGEFNRPDLEKIQVLLKDSLSNFQPFSIDIGKMGAFPSVSKPQVIWLGINTDDSLNELVDIVNQQCVKLGYPSEKRPFSAHITVGRLKTYASAAEAGMLGDIIQSRRNTEIGKQRVDALYFYKSELTPAGPIYQVLFTLPFSS